MCRPDLLHLCLTLSISCTARKLHSALRHYGSPRVCYNALHFVTLLLHHEMSRSGIQNPVSCRGFGTVLCGDTLYSSQLFLDKGTQCLLQPRFSAAGCAPVRWMGSSQTLSLVQLLFSVPYMSVKWKIISRFMLSAVTHMILTTQNKRLPKEHRQLTVCAECSRQAQDSWAMVRFAFDQPSYVACLYCSTYRALVAVMDTNVKWFDALQLRIKANI